MTDIAWLEERPVAHRGYHDLNKTRWENTLSAFAAADRKDYAIECDVHLSADGVPVVFHDHELKRLTGQDGYRLAAHGGANCRRRASAARPITCRRCRKCWRWSPAACRWWSS